LDLERGGLPNEDKTPVQYLIENHQECHMLWTNTVYSIMSSFTVWGDMEQESFALLFGVCSLYYFKKWKERLCL